MSNKLYYQTKICNKFMQYLLDTVMLNLFSNIYIYNLNNMQNYESYLVVQDGLKCIKFVGQLLGLLGLGSDQ